MMARPTKADLGRDPERIEELQSLAIERPPEDEILLPTRRDIRGPLLYAYPSPLLTPANLHSGKSGAQKERPPLLDVGCSHGAFMSQRPASKFTVSRTGLVSPGTFAERSSFHLPGIETSAIS
jgi:hypothetical protein